MFQSPRERQPGSDGSGGDGEAEASSPAAALERCEAGAGGPRGRLRDMDKPAVDADAGADYPWTDERERQICAQDFLVRHPFYAMWLETAQCRRRLFMLALFTYLEHHPMLFACFKNR